MPQLPSELPRMDAPQEDAAKEIQTSLQNKAELTTMERAYSKMSDEDSFGQMIAGGGSEKFSFNNEGFQVKDAYSELSDGTFVTRYDDFLQGADNEDIHAQRQSKGEKWTNGLGKFVGKTLVNTAGGFLGTAYGAISAISEGNWENVYDNEFYDFLDDQNTKMDNLSANYRSQEERDMGFFSSMGTANFWADDFLGGASFLVGTVISESLWAAATGGTSLTTTAGRVGLRASKYFKSAKDLTKGVKEASKTWKKYHRVESIAKKTTKTGMDAATDTAIKKTVWAGKTGEALNMARFTYTGAGFEAGMEARLYQKEQEKNFYRDFEKMNGRKPDINEISEFNDNLDKTTNMLFITNMALVGTSNLAILGKTFGVSSPFKLPSKELNKTVFGTGIKETFGEAGERVAAEAIKRTKKQKAIGFAKGVLKNPFYEGIVEEGGQATASTAMESYITSRYNPSMEAMDVVESMYEGMSHTYGTKEGWKEVGLGMLIGLIGGEASSGLSGDGVFTDARGALNDQDADSVKIAKSMIENSGTNVVNKMFATKFTEDLADLSEIQQAQQDFDKAQLEGSLVGMANAEKRILLTSVKKANDSDYTEEQVKDYEAALKMQDPKKVAEHFGIEESEVSSKISDLVGEYQDLSNQYKSAKEFADYTISDNPKELYEDATSIDVHMARQAIAYQMVMTDVMGEDLNSIKEAMNKSLQILGPALQSYRADINRYSVLRRAKQKDVGELSRIEGNLIKAENQIKIIDDKLNDLNRKKVSGDPAASKKHEDRIIALENSRDAIEAEFDQLISKRSSVNLKIEQSDVSSKMATERKSIRNRKSATQEMEAQLDAIDPFSETTTNKDGTVSELDVVRQDTLEANQIKLQKLGEALEEVRSTNPQEVAKLEKLAAEYKAGLEMWQRNAETISDLTNPELGLKRVGTMMQRKKQAGKTTLEFLKRLQQTQQEEVQFAQELDNVMNPTTVNQEEESKKTESQKESENKGEDAVKAPAKEDKRSRVQKLKDYLKELLGVKNNALQNLSTNADEIVDDVKPTSNEMSEFKKLKNQKDLSEEETTRLEELTKRFSNWRVITAGSPQGISVMDFLDQIETYENEELGKNEKISAEQTLEMAEQGRKKFSYNTINTDVINSPTFINIKRDRLEMQISHLNIESLAEFFTVEKKGTENRGDEKIPHSVTVYELTDADGKVFSIRKSNKDNRIIIPDAHVNSFLATMNMQTVKYNTGTSWGYVFRDGKLMKSDFKIANSGGTDTLSPQLIYELKEGDDVSFIVDMTDTFNSKEILDLIIEGRLEEAEALLSIYTVDKDGNIVGYLQANHGKISENNKNYLAVRKEAFEAFQRKLSGVTTNEDTLSGNSPTVIKLPFKVKVKETFVGSPNIQIDENRKPVIFKIPESEATDEKVVVGYGYAKKGKLQHEDASVKMSFIDKTVDTPYVIILHGNTKIAFPVGMLPSETDLREVLTDIVNSNSTEIQKANEIVKFLKQNNIDVNQFDLNLLKTNLKSEINKVYRAIKGLKETYGEKVISEMSREEFISNAEIVLDLNKDAFVSPKVETTLSTELEHTKTNKTTASKPLSTKEKSMMVALHLEALSQAKTIQEVAAIVEATGDSEFINEYYRSRAFAKQVNDTALAVQGVPVINTLADIEELILDYISIGAKDVPLDVKGEFSEEVKDLLSNPTTAKVKALAKKLKDALKNRYKVVSKSMDTENLYYIPTTQTKEDMFNVVAEDGSTQSYVRVAGDFYKKVDNKYTVNQLLVGLYAMYEDGNLPSHMNLEKGLSLEEFIKKMPSDQLKIYKKYYNTLPKKGIVKQSYPIGTDGYLKNEFETEFMSFIGTQKEGGTSLYKQVLSKLILSPQGILPGEATREDLDLFQNELGDFYQSYIEYSLINKHITNLQESYKKTIFVYQDTEMTDMAKAVNSAELETTEGKDVQVDGDMIAVKGLNEVFIQHDNAVYKLVNSSNGTYTYLKVVDIDPKFVITEIETPFSNFQKTESEKGKEIEAFTNKSETANEKC